MITLNFDNGKLLIPEFGAVLDLKYVTFNEFGDNWVLNYNTRKIISRNPVFFQDENGDPFTSITAVQTAITENIVEPYFQVKQKTNPISNQVANVYVEYDSIDVTPTQNGQHIVEIDFVESYNVNRNNFMANLVVSGGLSETINFLNYEPKEIGGSGVNTTEATTGLTVNSDTDVRNPRRFRFVYDLTAGNDYNFSLQFAGEENNAEAVIYRSVISVEFKPNSI